MQKNHYLKYGNVDSWQERLENSPQNGHKNAENWDGFEIYGSLPSPPCVKLATYLRWKRLPFLWRSPIDDSMQMVFDEARFSHIEESMMPYAVFPDGRSMNDSTFIMRAIEERYPDRAVFPKLEDDPHLRFVSQLLEDFADEWLVRCVYGFRWNSPEVRAFSGNFVAQSFIGGGDAAEGFASFIVPRQLSTDNRADAFVEGAYTDDIIYPTFKRVADAMENHFSSGMRADKFMCGAAPANVDFAFYGMFYQFIQDKIPSALMQENYPSVTAWTHRMNDTSGYDESSPRFNGLLEELLAIAADSYLPWLKVNAERLFDNPENHDMITVTIFTKDEEEGVVHSQRPYPYQAKCWQWLKEDLHAAMQSSNSHSVETLIKTLSDTNCIGFLSPDPAQDLH